MPNNIPQEAANTSKLKESVNQERISENLVKYLVSEGMSQIEAQENIGGVCYGLSICHAAMDRIGKLKWWEAVLKQIASWDGKSSLDQNVNLVSLGAEKECSLKSLFFKASNYILFNHADANKTPNLKDFILSGMNQGSILKPGGRQLEGYALGLLSAISDKNPPAKHRIYIERPPENDSENIFQYTLVNPQDGTLIEKQKISRNEFLKVLNKKSDEESIPSFDFSNGDKVLQELNQYQEGIIKIISSRGQAFAKPETTSFFELSEKKADGSEQIHTIKSDIKIGAHFPLELLSKFTDINENLLKSDICLMHSKTHTIRIGYKEGKWLVYDPNYNFDISKDEGITQSPIYHSFSSKNEMLAAALATLNNIGANNHVTLQFSSFSAKKLAVSTVGLFNSDENAINMMRKGGLTLLATTSPEVLEDLFTTNKLNQKNVLSQVIESITWTDNIDKFTGLHTLAFYAPNFLNELIKKIDNSDLGKKLQATIVDYLADQTVARNSALEIMVKKSPQAFFQLMKSIVDSAEPDKANFINKLSAAFLVTNNQNYSGLAVFLNHIVTNRDDNSKAQFIKLIQDSQNASLVNLMQACLIPNNEGWRSLQTIFYDLELREAFKNKGFNVSTETEFHSSIANYVSKQAENETGLQPISTGVSELNEFVTTFEATSANEQLGLVEKIPKITDVKALENLVKLIENLTLDKNTADTLKAKSLKILAPMLSVPYYDGRTALHILAEKNPALLNKLIGFIDATPSGKEFQAAIVLLLDKKSKNGESAFHAMAKNAPKALARFVESFKLIPGKKQEYSDKLFRALLLENKHKVSGLQMILDQLSDINLNEKLKNSLSNQLVNLIKNLQPEKIISLAKELVLKNNYEDLSGLQIFMKASPELLVQFLERFNSVQELYKWEGKEKLINKISSDLFLKSDSSPNSVSELLSIHDSAFLGDRLADQLKIIFKSLDAESVAKISRDLASPDLNGGTGLLLLAAKSPELLVNFMGVFFNKIKLEDKKELVDDIIKGLLIENSNGSSGLREWMGVIYESEQQPDGPLNQEQLDILVKQEQLKTSLKNNFISLFRDSSKETLVILVKALSVQDAEGRNELQKMGFKTPDVLVKLIDHCFKQDDPKAKETLVATLIDGLLVTNKNKAFGLRSMLYEMGNDKLDQEMLAQMKKQFMNLIQASRPDTLTAISQALALPNENNSTGLRLMMVYAPDLLTQYMQYCSSQADQELKMNLMKNMSKALLHQDIHGKTGLYNLFCVLQADGLKERNLLNEQVKDFIKNSSEECFENIVNAFDHGNRGNSYSNELIDLILMECDDVAIELINKMNSAPGVKLKNIILEYLDTEIDGEKGLLALANLKPDTLMQFMKMLSQNSEAVSQAQMKVLSKEINDLLENYALNDFRGLWNKFQLEKSASQPVMSKVNESIVEPTKKASMVPEEKKLPDESIKKPVFPSIAIAPSHLKSANPKIIAMKPPSILPILPAAPKIINAPKSKTTTSSIKSPELVPIKRSNQPIIKKPSGQNFSDQFNMLAKKTGLKVHTIEGAFKKKLESKANSDFKELYTKCLDLAPYLKKGLLSLDAVLDLKETQHRGLKSITDLVVKHGFPIYIAQKFDEQQYVTFSDFAQYPSSEERNLFIEQIGQILPQREYEELLYKCEIALGNWQGEIESKESANEDKDHDYDYANDLFDDMGGDIEEDRQEHFMKGGPSL